MSDPISGAGPGGPEGIFEALRDGRIQGDEARLKAAASLLESSFYQELFKAMRDTVPDTGLLSGGGGEEMFTSLLDQHLADEAAARLERGLAEALYRQLQPVRSGDGPAASDALPGGPGADSGTEEGAS
jgi:Rod binding domain-containing protein